MSKLTVTLVETVAHKFEFDTNDIPEDIDLQDPEDILHWADRYNLVDYTNGEQIGERELSVSMNQGELDLV